ARQPRERVDAYRDGDGPHAAVAQGELTEARVVAAEPFLGPEAVVRPGGQGPVNRPGELLAGDPHHRADVVAVVDRIVARRLLPELVCQDVLFPEQEGVAQSVGDVRKPAARPPAGDRIAGTERDVRVEEDARAEARVAP